jgi:hypothetical protein
MIDHSKMLAFVALSENHISGISVERLDQLHHLLDSCL